MRNHTFNIDLPALAACAPAMANDEARYYLNGVHVFERDGRVVYEATNAHILIQAESDALQDGMDFAGLNIIVPAFLVNYLAKKSFQAGFGVSKDCEVPCVIDATRMTVEMVDGTISFKTIDGTFPDTMRVIPEKGSCKNLDFDAIGFSPAYMGKIGKSLNTFTGGNFLSMRFSGNTGCEPILIECSSPNWRAVLMPARV